MELKGGGHKSEREGGREVDGATGQREELGLWAFDFKLKILKNKYKQVSKLDPYTSPFNPWVKQTWPVNSHVHSR